MLSSLKFTITSHCSDLIDKNRVVCNVISLILIEKNVGIDIVKKCLITAFSPSSFLFLRTILIP